MATLSQLLGGGDTFAKQKELYDRLGSPKGPYTGSYDQNIFLLNNQNKWNATPAATPAVGDPFSSLKNQALSSSILKEIMPYEEVNPFTNFFNEDLVRGTFSQLFKPEQDRLSQMAQQDYTTATGDVNRNFDTTVRNANQNYADRGAFFGGVRNAGVNKVNEERDRSLGTLLTNKERTDFDRQREFNRQTEEQVQREKAFKNQQYLDEKNRYITNPRYK